MKLILIFLGVVVMSHSSVLFSEPLDWRLKRDRSDIKVYVSDTSGTNLHSFKAVSKVKTTIPALVNLMRDMSVMDKWLETCRDPEVIEEPDAVSRVIHMKNKAPFILVSDRDLVLLQRFRRVDENVVIVDLEDRGHMISHIDGHVRGTFNGHWKFTQLDEGTVEVEYKGLTDPHGKVAPWMANIAVLDVPFSTLKKIRKILHNKSTQYDGPMGISLL